MIKEWLTCSARKRIYRVILELLDDENKLQISCKLCQNILGPLVDNDEVNSLNNDIHSPQLNTIIDTFAILCSKELKIGSRTKADDEDLPAEVVESKKAVLSKVSICIWMWSSWKRELCSSKCYLFLSPSSFNWKRREAFYYEIWCYTLKLLQWISSKRLMLFSMIILDWNERLNMILDTLMRKRVYDVDW